MKKIILTALFLCAFITANAVETNITDPELKCHAEACQMVADFEEEYGDEFTFDEYEAIYEFAFTVCK